MNAPSVDIKDLIEGTSALGLTFAADLFVSEMPPTPDECVSVHDTGGYGAEVDYTYERPTVQVRVRGGKGEYEVAHAIAQDIRDALNGQANVSLNGARYVGIWCEGDVMSLGYDDNHRPLFTVNFRLHRTDA
jgi:hypothetical protein